MRLRGYQCRMFELRPGYLLINLVVLALLTAPLAALPAEDTAVNAERPAEYMIYQYPATILVLKFDVSEAEFSVRTLGPEGAQLKSSSVPGRRLGPVYQYIDTSERPRQLMIEVAPGRAMGRSDIGLEVLQFSPDDRNSAPLLRAYQMLSLGTETSHSTDAATWASKAYSLRNAGDIFAGLGWEEMRLWSEYFAAHLVLRRLEDPLMAMEWAVAIQRDAARAGFARVELAARILEGDAVLQLAAESGEQSAKLYYERAHQVLAHVEKLSEQQALDGERGRALLLDGGVYELQGEPERALERYQTALDVTAGSGDVDLQNQIRASAASVYEALGRTSGAISMLDDIADDLVVVQQENLDLERAAGLFDKGRLLNSSYRYPEAVSELARALELQQANAQPWLWGPTGLELAWSYYAMGDTEQALSLLEASLSNTPEQGNRDVLIRAYSSLGNIHRERREFERAARARERQAELIEDGAGRAAYLTEAALDEWHRPGVQANEAQDLLQRARSAAAREDDALSAHRATLYLCLLQLERNQGSGCEAAAATAYEALRTSGIPRVAADAGLARALIQRRSDSVGAARDTMEALIDELYWYRRMLPGVLGAWYGEHRDELAREFLAQVRELASGQGTGKSDGTALLLAMERVRMLEAVDYARPGKRLADTEEESLRSLLARREAGSGNDVSRLAAEANDRLAAARRSTGAVAGTVSETSLKGMLAGLGRSEAVLAYYFNGRQTQALVASRGGVQAIDLPGMVGFEERLDQLRNSWTGTGSSALPGLLDVLGLSLLEPLAGDLPEKIYLLPAGPLRGIPLDALRLNGEYFAEHHELVNLASLDSIARRSLAMTRNFPERVFLAGNPQEQGDPFSLEFRASPEIGAVTDQFVGPGLHIVQGVALQKHEFQDDRLAQAALVHLALAGTLDLDVPDRSRLLLAPVGAGHADSSSFLAPPDVRGLNIAAQLVVLSGTAVVGSGRSPADSRLAFVADFLEAGSAAVLVSYRTAGEVANAEFTTDLYRRLQSGPDVGAALARTKRARIEADSATNLPYWAGFQLFIR